MIAWAKTTSKFRVKKEKLRICDKTCKLRTNLWLSLMLDFQSQVPVTWKRLVINFA